jgi:hypothetical protein
MIASPSSLRRMSALLARCLTTFCRFAMVPRAQELAARITELVDDSDRITLAGSRPPMARPENDVGWVPSGVKLEGMSTRNRLL